MLGDIVPSNTNPHADGAPKPADQPKTGGYGSSGFGVPKPSSPPSAVAPAATAAPRPSGSRIPLVLTIVGIIVFVGGVSGLFMYAMSS